MNPKEKAKELIERYKFESEYNCQPSTVSGLCKKCALIAVDEIILALKTTTGHCELRDLDWHEVQNDFEYWNDVKQELSSL